MGFIQARRRTRVSRRIICFSAYDNAQAPNSNSVTNVANYYTLTGGSVGARIAQQISFVVSGNTADPPGNTHFFQGLACTATINGTLGGTAGTYAGSITGNNTIATLGPNGKYVGGMLGMEIDVAAMAGSSVHYKGGLLVALQGLDAVESDAAPSIAIGIGLSSDSPASPGWSRGISFGSAGGWWPINAGGVMIYADPAAVAGGPPHTCGTGIDFSAVTFGYAAFVTKGFLINPKGGIDFGASDAASATDTTRHIDIYEGLGGINAFGGQFNLVGPAWIFRTVADVQMAYVSPTGFVSLNSIGAWGAAGPGSKPTVTGAKTDLTNAGALKSLLTALASYGLLTDSST